MAVEDNQYSFDTVEENEIALPISCHSGAYSSCAGKVISREVDQSDQSFLNDEQIADDCVLTCVAYPVSDCIIQTHQEDALL